MNHFPARLVVPASLALAGVAFLIGCLPVPSYHREDGAVRPEKRIGGPRSGKPLELGRATRADVIRILGAPASDSHGGNTMLYEYRVVETVWLVHLCFFTQAIPEESKGRLLQLEFGANGTLRRFRVLKSGE